MSLSSFRTSLHSRCQTRRRKSRQRLDRSRRHRRLWIESLDWHIDDELHVIQMVCDGLINEQAGDCVRLGAQDIPEMMELTGLTNPGPFNERTIEMGLYYGIRIEGRLAAMAGERMHPEAFCEVSGVCTHPDFRGRGLAKILVSHMTGLILERGETPFLHALKRSETFEIARGTYEKLGYKHRVDLCLAVLTKR